jgi:hypothetical protein
MAYLTCQTMSFLATSDTPYSSYQARNVTPVTESQDGLYACCVEHIAWTSTTNNEAVTTIGQGVNERGPKTNAAKISR